MLTGTRYCKVSIKCRSFGNTTWSAWWLTKCFMNNLKGMLLATLVPPILCQDVQCIFGKISTCSYYAFSYFINSWCKHILPNCELGVLWSGDTVWCITLVFRFEMSTLFKPVLSLCIQPLRVVIKWDD